MSFFIFYIIGVVNLGIAKKKKKVNIGMCGLKYLKKGKWDPKPK